MAASLTEVLRCIDQTDLPAESSIPTFILHSFPLPTSCPQRCIVRDATRSHSALLHCNPQSFPFVGNAFILLRFQCFFDSSNTRQLLLHAISPTKSIPHSLLYANTEPLPLEEHRSALLLRHPRVLHCIHAYLESLPFQRSSNEPSAQELAFSFRQLCPETHLAFNPLALRYVHIRDDLDDPPPNVVNNARRVSVKDLNQTKLVLLQRLVDITELIIDFDTCSQLDHMSSLCQHLAATGHDLHQLRALTFIGGTNHKDETCFLARMLLCCFTDLISLTLRRCEICPSRSSIAREFPRQLTRLHITESNVTDACLSTLADVSLPHLIDLSVRYGEITSFGAKELCARSDFRSLKYLSLCSNAIDGSIGNLGLDQAAFADSLCKLHLSDNRIACFSAFRVKARLPKLTHLCCDDNPLIERTANNWLRHLHSLSINVGWLSDSGFSSLARGLDGSSTLQLLELGANMATSSGVRELVSIKLPLLQSLNLYGNECSNAVREIGRALRYNFPELTFLDLTLCGIETFDDALDEIEGCRSLLKLKKLLLDHNKMDGEEREIVSQELEKVSVSFAGCGREAEEEVE